MQDRAVELRAIIIVSARHVDSWVRTHGPMLRSVAWSLLLGAVGAGFVLAGALWRAWSLRPDRRLERGTTVAARTQPASLALFLGSGGHTAELLQMAAALPSERYSPRTYIVSGGDELSARKAHQAEKARAGMQTEAQTPKNKDGRKVSAYRVLTLPRARNVGQSWLTTPITTLRSLVSASWLVFAGPKLDVVLMNGPGTCVPLVAATYLLRVCAQLPCTGPKADQDRVCRCWGGRRHDWCMSNRLPALRR